MIDFIYLLIFLIVSNSKCNNLINSIDRFKASNTFFGIEALQINFCFLYSLFCNIYFNI